MSALLLLTFVLVVVGPFLVVGTIAAVASIECPELRPTAWRRAPRQAVAAWA